MNNSSHGESGRFDKLPRTEEEAAERTVLLRRQIDQDIDNLNMQLTNFEGLLRNEDNQLHSYQERNSRIK